MIDIKGVVWEYSKKVPELGPGPVPRSVLDSFVGGFWKSFYLVLVLALVLVLVLVLILSP